MPDGRFRLEAGDGSWLDRVEPMWEKLRNHHAERGGRHAPSIHARTFDMRRADLTGKTGSLADIYIVFAFDTETNTVAGYLVATVEPSGRGELDSLYVLEDYRKQGLGSELFERGLAWLRERGADPITLSVMVGNEDVMSLYARYGFIPRNVVMALIENED